MRLRHIRSLLLLFCLSFSWPAMAQTSTTPKLGPYFDPWVQRVAQGDPLAQFELVMELRAAGCGEFKRYVYELQDKALPGLEKKAKEGDTLAMYYLARLLFMVPRKEYQAAWEWANKVVEKGDPLLGYSVLSAICAQSDSPYRNEVKEKEFFAKYREIETARLRAGDEETMLRMFSPTGGGGGGLTRFEYNQALLTCANKGDRWAQYRLGKEMFGKTPEILVQWGFFPVGTDPKSLTRDDVRQQGTEWLLKSAAQDNYDAAIQLADLTDLMRVDLPGMDSNHWLKEAERMLGARNYDLEMIYEGHPDDEITEGDEEQAEESEADPEPPAPVKAVPKKAASKPQPKPVSSAPKKQTAPKPRK